MTFWWWVAQHGATTALLVAVATVACRFLRTRPALQHALWVVVLIKFLMPPWVVWPLSATPLSQLAYIDGLAPRLSPIEPVGPGAEHFTAPSSQFAAPATDPARIERGSQPRSSLATHDSAEPETVGSEPIIKAPSRLPDFSPAVDLVADTRKPQPSDSFRSWLPRAAAFPPDLAVLAVWLLGSVVVAVRQARRIASHGRLVRRATAAPTHLTAEVAQLARELGVRSIPVFVAEEISSPFVWCLGRLKMIWPAQIVDDTSLIRWQGVIAHELAHVRRRDHWTAWLELLAGIVWWWNPLFWFARRRLRESAEITCDALAVGMLPAGRRAYAEAFLELSLPPRSTEPAPALGVGSRDRKSFERRLSMILSPHVVGKISWPGLLAVAVLAIVAIPSWSPGQAEQPSRRWATIRFRDARHDARSREGRRNAVAGDAQV